MACNEPFGGGPLDELRVSSSVEKLRAELLGRFGGLRHFRALRNSRLVGMAYPSEAEVNREGGCEVDK